MEIVLKEITIREITKNYKDREEEGVIGYDGKLNIRPKYQREFVYDEKKRNAVIETIRKDFPLNVMYWVDNGDGTYEILDGQQRTISFCQYVQGDFSILIDGYPKSFSNLTAEEKKKILDYKCMIYQCKGTDKEKLEWFRIINIAGEKLTDQELRNATYTGTWLTNAKSIFSKSNCAAYLLSKDYVGGSPIRQDILEKALDWISKGNIENYMSIHQHDETADELWTYFQTVINWVKITFPNYRKEMKGLNWGSFYDKYKNNQYSPTLLEERIKILMIDDEVTKKSGVYEYLLSGENEKYLHLRSFTTSQKRAVYEKQNGICSICKEHFEIDDMEGDHITPWSEGGKTDLNNCQMLCRDCNRQKSNK